MNINNYLIKQQSRATAFLNKKLEIVYASDQWINSFYITDRKIKIIGFVIFLFVQYNVFGQTAASQNYETQTGTLGTTYDWIDCSGGTTILDSGDDVQTNISWPFNFSYYDNNYTTSNNLSVASNGFIRLDGVADGGNWTGARDYVLNANATQLGQIIALAMYDGNLNQSNDGIWIRSLVTGSAPQRIFTIEYNQLEIDYNDNKYTDVQISFYESTNRIILKLRDEDLSKNDVDMGLHSGVSGYFDYWQEVKSGSIGWIEYTQPNIEVSDLNNIAYFPTLKDAFDKINDGTFGGEVDIKINNSTSEYASPILNSSGTGSSNYASINIYPTKSGLSITGNLAGPFIDLRGADNITFDGRVNAMGTTKDLTIVNLNTSNTNHTSTIRFINGATNNTVQYCSIKGAPSKSNSAILLFRTSNSSLGNSNNTIDNNDITGLTTSDRPNNVIFSLGTNGKKNSNNTISNNNIYDFFRPNSTSYGIFLNKNNLDWIIDGNSFYETTSFSTSGAYSYQVIRARNAAINGLEIKNNFIGGSAPLGMGEWNKNGGTNNAFNAIYIFAGTTTPTSIQNNTIKNFNWTNSANAQWAAIRIAAGDVNIGNISGNTIGETTGTGSIKVTGGSNIHSIYGIRIASTGVINCSNNNIGSISGIALSTNATNLYGIHLSSDFIGEINNNNIGSTTTSLSINVSNLNTTRAHSVYGIYSANKGTTTIHENIISNLYNTTSLTNTGSRRTVTGIYADDGVNDINQNIISELSISSAFNNGAISSAAGIYLNTKADSQIIENNTIYNISNEYNLFTGDVSGIVFRNSAGASASSVNSNFIHSLGVSSNTNAKIYGIYEDADNAIFSNNIITFGENSDTQLFGIYDVGSTGNTVDFFFNSIYLSGTNSGSSNSYALRFNTGNNTRGLRNNILFNNRTGGTGKHYAVYYNTTAGTFTADYNDYFVNATNVDLGYFGGNQSTLALLQTATSQDANSLNTDPLYSAAGGITYLNYSSTGVLSGVTIPSILTDYEEITRNNPPKMGALESSLGFVWQGNTSTDFAAAANWQYGVIPTDGADISFAANPANDCNLDQNRTLKDITNTSAQKFVVNGHQFTLTGNITEATTNQIDASSASSIVVFEGTAGQSIPMGVFVSNAIDGLTVNNSKGLTQNGAITVQTVLTLTNGAFTIGANTLTINGSISTTSGVLAGGSSSNISIGGIGSSTIVPSVMLDNLTLNRSNGVSLGGDVTVEGTLSLTAGTLTIGANTLTLSGNTPSRTSGNINSSNAEASLVFTNSSAIVLPTSVFTGSLNNLTINGAGVTSSEDYTLNGILNLQSANPSATTGSLDMGNFTLLMGDTATTVGIGDVTGNIKRTIILPNIEYTFGNQFNSVTFPDIGTLPSEITLKVNIGVAPSWKPDGVKRILDISQIGGSGTRGFLKAHYLDSELNGLNENDLGFFSYVNPSSTLLDRGVTEINSTENWLTLSNTDFGNLPPIFGIIEHSFGATVADIITWDGSIDTDWYNPSNWTPAVVPSLTTNVVIPDAATTSNDPLITDSSSTTILTLDIRSGGVLNAGTLSELTLVGSAGAWKNNGSFNANTGKVIFNNGIASEIVTIAGITDFYNIEVGPNTTLEPVAGNTLRIAGAGTADITSFVDFSTANNTVEWNGTDQTIVNPNGIGGNSGYYNLVLSGSGTKTMPNTSMNIAGDFIIAGTENVTAQSALSIGSELEILTGATFTTGAFDHSVGGHFNNTGTFTSTTGTTITLNGTGLQNIYGESEINFENLIIDNSIGVDVFTDITVHDVLTLNNGNLNIGETTLTINGGLVKTSGFIDVNSLSSLTFGGTTGLNLPNSLFLTTPSINNLTVNRTGGIIAASDITVEGILNLQSSNPSPTIGSFDTGSNTLIMGDSATTIGVGDVTGNIKRTTILPNIEYTFGNQYTSVIFPNVGTLPTEITLKVNIGAAPSWKPDGVKRILDISQIGASDTRAILKAHYLDSELNGLNENDLGYFSYVNPSSTLLDRGVTEINSIDNWITFSNANFGNLFSSFGIIEHSFAVSISDIITWDGSVDTDWYNPSNWTPAVVPSLTTNVVIPDAATTSNDPLITDSSSTTILTLDIRSGGVLNAGTLSELTLVGSAGAWKNNGSFNANTGKVIFNNGIASEIVTIAGITDFYNIEVGPNTTLEPVAGNTLRIAGAGTADITSFVDFSTANNTVEWNGTDQTIVNPNGIEGNSGYYNLVLSGSGTKTMPNTSMNIAGDFSISGTATGTAAEVLVISGNTVIDNGAIFETGSFNHLLAGNFENNGTFTGTSGGVISFNGTTAQTILGISTTNFDNLTIENEFDVTQTSNVNVNNVLLFNDGNLIVGNTTLGINGTINNISGAIEVSAVSNLSFGGTTALTLNNNLFTSEPLINNLTINRSGGVVLGNQNMNIDGTLALTSGTFTLLANTLTLSGNSPTRVSGNIDASDSGSEIAFTNNSSIALPSDLFSTSITNFTVNGTGGVVSNLNITIAGILNLVSANPSATQGGLDMNSATLNMGATATTIGQGDVSGIIRRTSIVPETSYSFGNQHSTVYFSNVGTLPTEMSLKVTLGSSPFWKTGMINRVYDIIQTGASGTEALIKNHYLDSELNGNDENLLGEWLHIYALPFTIDYGRSGNNINDNWVTISNVNIGVFSSNFGDIEISLDEYANFNLTWNGSTSSSWVTASNWTPAGAPSDITVVTIPDATATNNDPTIPVLAICKEIKIENGGVLNAINDANLTLTGSTGAWINNGTFNSNTSNIIFAHGINSNTVTIDGATDFYDITVNDKTWLQPAAGSIIRIENELNFENGSILDFTTNNNTIEYNGLDQTVINPTGGVTPGYNDLTLSGSGTKTFSGTAIATGGITVSESLTINGDGAGSTFVQAAASAGIATEGVFTVASGKTVAISDMTIRYGNNTISGGGINNRGTLIITDANVSNNVTSLNGGGIYNDGGILTVINSTLSNNTATNGGGIYSNQSLTDPTLTVTNSTISDNLTTRNGGGISLESNGRTTITNSTIANNHSDNDNSSIGTGGGVYNNGNALTVTNSIIANNYKGSRTATGDDYYYSSSSLTDGGYNVVKYSNVATNATGGFNSISSILYNTINAQVGTSFSSWTQGGSVLTNQILGLSSTLALNGAINETYTLNLASGSFALAGDCKGIPSLNNWNNSPQISGVYADQRGVVRAANQSTSIGAYSANYTAGINPTAGGSIGNAQAICPDTTPDALISLAPPTGHTGTLEYKWQSSTTGATSGFADIASSNLETYSPGVLAETTWFTRLARVSCEGGWSGTASSNVIEITAVDGINPTISCIGNQSIDNDVGEIYHTVSGTEFDPIVSGDNCGIGSIINDFNSLASLAGAQLPIGINTIVWTITDTSGIQEICTFDVEVNSTLGIDTIEESNISIFPNPTNGITKLIMTNITVQKISVLSLSGAIIFEKVNPNQNEIVIDLSSLSSGVYLIYIKTNESMLIKKIIKI